MQPHTEPCPMCGKNQNDYERMIEEREEHKKRLLAFLAGRRSIEKFSSRENDIFDAYYDHDIRDFQQIADNYGISYQAVSKYYERAMEKLILLDFEI